MATWLARQGRATLCSSQVTRPGSLLHPAAIPAEGNTLQCCSTTALQCLTSAVHAAQQRRAQEAAEEPEPQQLQTEAEAVLLRSHQGQYGDL